MTKIHTKSSCCRAVVYRFGQRRRQCSVCSKTWSIRSKKRGRKCIRVHPNQYQFAGPFQESLRHKAQRIHKGRELVRHRHSANMKALLKIPRPSIPQGPYIAIVDGFLVFFQHKPFTVYFVLIRPTRESVAHILEPYFETGVETIRGWEHAFNTRPVAN